MREIWHDDSFTILFVNVLRTSVAMKSLLLQET